MGNNSIVYKLKVLGVDALTYAVQHPVNVAVGAIVVFFILITYFSFRNARR